jgi:dihydrolipoamide dehydrogenase
MDLHCDVAVIGAGTAGLAAERSARRTGARTLIIDPGFSGTTCATVGCMPSKLLIAAARAAHGARHAALFGVMARPQVDGAAVMARLRAERDHFTQTTLAAIADLPASVILRGMARFADGTTLVLEDGTRIAARAIVIATGARPAVPEPFAPLGDLVLTNETLFDLETLPETLAVVGAGPLGLELAQAMARLGVAVTLLDKAETLGAIHDPAIAQSLHAMLAREMTIALGVEIRAGVKDGKAWLAWGDPGDEHHGMFDRVLVATGRPPRLEGLDLEAAGLALDNHGIPRFDRETMHCGGSAIFIAGDAAADRPVLHEASAEGAIAGYNAACWPDVAPTRRMVPLSILFTDPPLATIGRTDAEGLATGEASYADQGRARVEGVAQGLVRLHADPNGGRLLGATLLCPAADHLAHLIAWAIEDGRTAAELLQRPFYHPSLEEGLKPALRRICAQVGTPMGPSSDEGAPAGA